MTLQSGYWRYHLYVIVKLSKARLDEKWFGQPRTERLEGATLSKVDLEVIQMWYPLGMHCDSFTNIVDYVQIALLIKTYRRWQLNTYDVDRVNQPWTSNHVLFSTVDWFYVYGLSRFFGKD